MSAEPGKLDKDVMKRVVTEYFAFPGADSPAISGDRILSSGLDNAVKVLWWADKTGTGDYAADYVNWEHAEQLKKALPRGTYKKTLGSLMQSVTNMQSRDSFPVDDKESIRIVLSLAHFLLNKDAPGFESKEYPGSDYQQSGKYYRDSIEFGLKKLDIGPLIPESEILQHMDKVQPIVKRVDAWMRERAAAAGRDFASRKRKNDVTPAALGGLRNAQFHKSTLWQGLDNAGQSAFLPRHDFPRTSLAELSGGGMSEAAMDDAMTRFGAYHRDFLLTGGNREQAIQFLSLMNQLLPEKDKAHGREAVRDSMEVLGLGVPLTRQEVAIALPSIMAFTNPDLPAMGDQEKRIRS